MAKGRFFTGLVGLIGLGIIFLSACRERIPTIQPELPNQPSTLTPTTLTDTPQSNIIPSASPTAVLELSQPQQTKAPLLGAALPTAPPEPLRFVFPSPQPAPVSAWRPPLYPTPWALSPYDHFYFSRPIAADQINWPSQNYRYGGEFFEDVIHTGVDIPAPLDTPVLAAGAGKVIWAGYGVYRGGYDTTDPYGLAVVIRHEFGYHGQDLYTIYGHLKEIDVIEGQFIQTGVQLGLVGETGRVTGPHLHFEVRLGENSFFATRNPELWIVPPVGWGVLAGQILDSNGRYVSAQPIVVTSSTTGQNWFSRSYGVPGPVNSDPYYLENLVVGDLPAGSYLLRLNYAGVSYTDTIEIYAGQVNYFYFNGKDGFEVAPPPTPVPLTVEDDFQTSP
jgi:murein DD-endopeptidase MepM/ murein hydrolase activator NlpD